VLTGSGRVGATAPEAATTLRLTARNAPLTPPTGGCQPRRVAKGEDRVAAFEREFTRRLEAASSLFDGYRADDTTDTPADSGTVADHDLPSRTDADLKALQARYAETRARLDDVNAIVRELERKVRDLKAKNATMKARHTSSVRKLEEEVRDLKATNATMKARYASSVSFTAATRAALRRNDMQVVVTRVVPGLGGDCVDAFPLTPGKVIRFEHPSRPAYQPTAIQLGVSMANGAENFSDLEIQFYLVGGDRREGRRFGPKFRGDQFVDCYGAPINVQWPLHQGRPVIVGSLERLAVEVRHRGLAHHVNSIAVVVFGISGHRLAET